MALTSSLYAVPSFLEGAARVLDLGGTMEKYNGSSAPESADARALAADWAAVGLDLRNAMMVVNDELRAQAKQG
jgi:hypothetical protein